MTDEREGFRGGALYPELWKLCAGPLVTLPSPGERVFYFPQGHMEQLDASTNQEFNQQILAINVPSKILCRVQYVKLLAEQETDEVYAEIVLFPESDQSVPTIPDPYVPEPPTPATDSFCKILTVSDTNSGGFSVHQKHATNCLPPLASNEETPSQELVAQDLHGCEWNFKHIFRGQPRRHLFTTGWSTFLTFKRLVVGDALVFLRCGNGELGVGVRRFARQQIHMPSPVISTHCMLVGVLAAPKLAISTSSRFFINYKPRTSQFIVGVNKYLKAINNKFCLGMRCQMRVEGEDPSKIRRIIGTIVGVGDFSPHWSKSEWRSLKVQWDEHAVPWPKRVSPWEIEQVALVPLDFAQPVVTSKKPKTSDFASSVQSSSSQVVWSLRQKESNHSSWSSYFSSKICVEGIWSSPNTNLSLSLFADSQEGNKNVFMRSRPPSFPSPLQLGSSRVDLRLFNDVSMETQSKHECTVSMRSRTKVHMEGVVDRVVDLAMLKGYDDLLDELEKMFEIKGELRPTNKWEVSFTDDDDDDNKKLCLGDDAWPEFCKMVKKIFISKCQDQAN